MTLTAVALTDIGQIRGRNEDSFLLDLDASLFAIADGMGGHAAGDVASQTAVAALAASFAETHSVVMAMKSANRAVVERGAAEPRAAGMGTTMTAVHIKGTTLLGAHVGDSRLYRLRHGELRLLTRDHTVAQDMIDRGALTPVAAMQHPANSMLTRSLGSRPDVEIDAFQEELISGDRLLLCTDGLTSMVNEDDVQSILARQKTPDEIAAELVEAANLRGGVDNITVILIGV